MPGLRSIQLLRGLDGTKVISHMRWDSQAAFRQATINNPRIAATMQHVAELIEAAEPGLYEVVDP
jgi:heme-degrading monooxygenase HmoA